MCGCCDGLCRCVGVVMVFLGVVMRCVGMVMGFVGVDIARVCGCDDGVFWCGDGMCGQCGKKIVCVW